MKPSKFNTFFPHEGYQIGFNAYSNEFLILEPYLYELYKIAKTDDFEELLLHNPEFYNLLKEKEFFIDEQIDEVDRIRQISHLIDNDDTKFKLHINPTMNCNFKCWYCYETHIKDSRMDQLTISNTEAFVKQVFSNKKELKEFSLSWFGGEPLLYFHKVVVPILQSTHQIAEDNNVYFNSAITTNGLLIDQSVIDICLKYNLNFFQITLDGNREKHDKVRFISEGRGSYDKIVENIFQLAKNKITVNIRINISVETLVGIDDIINDFHEMNEEDRRWIHFDLHKVWQVTNDIDNEINEYRWLFRKNGFVVSSGSHDTVMNSCYGDHRNHATINYNGEVFKCTARDFTTANSEGILKDGGFIEWNNKLEKRLNSKFKNKPCLECPILPLCGGGCTQQAIEHEGIDYCVYEFDESKKLEVVKNKFFELIAEHA